MITKAEVHSSSRLEKRARPRVVRPLLQTQTLTKDYPGLRALDSMNFDLRKGEVHILFGENGAGKSTLVSMLAGANTPSSGKILYSGKTIKLTSVHQARDLGISAVFQEFSLIPEMTVSENLFLGDELTRHGLLKTGQMREKVTEILDRLDFQIDPRTKVNNLTRAEQQMVEIAKAFRSDLSVLILDEPTASLTNHEAGQLFALIKKLKQRGVGIIYITHRMNEVHQIGDRITILRDGRHVDTVEAGKTSEKELVRLMTGRVVGEIFPSISYNPGKPILKTINLCTSDGGVTNVSLTVKRGEIVGIAGLVGSGKSRFGQACFNALPCSSGEIEFMGTKLKKRSVRTMINKGMLYLPSDRRLEGLMMMRSGRENIALASLDRRPFSNGWILHTQSEKNIVMKLADRFKLSPRRTELAAGHFSGGNQQKLMLARSLTRTFDLIIFDEPTVGVDVGTRVEIYKFIADLCSDGVAILLISSDLPEILHLTNRTYVFSRGRVQAELSGKDITETNILSHFFEKDAA